MNPPRRHSTMAWVLAAGIVAIGLLWLALRPASGASVDSTEGRYVIAGGVLRDGGQGWRWYTSGHASANTGPVRCDRRTGILHAGIASAGGPVGFGAVTPDETLARHGITAGVSATRDTLRVHLFKAGRAISCMASIFDRPSANLWALWMVPA